MVEGYPNDLGGWGAPAIFKEAGRLLSKYIRILHPFILAFLLPVALIQLLEIYGAAWMFSHHHHHHHHPHPHPHPHHHGDHPFGFHHHGHRHHHPFGGFHSFYAHSHDQGSMAKFAGDAYAPAPHPHPPHHPPLLALLIGALVMILVWLLVSLAIAAISKVVAYIYSNNEEDPSIVKSVFQSLPSALYRLFITTLWLLLFTIAAVFIISLPFHLILWLLSSKVNAHIVLIINKVVVDIALLVLGFVFLLSSEVAVLEPANFGLAALKKSFKLVESKIVAAIIFFLVNIIVGLLISKLEMLAVFLPVTGKVPYWTVWIFGVIVAILYLVYLVYFLLVAIVLYFSTKLQEEADHHYLPVNSGDDNPYTPLVVPAEN